MMMRSLCLVLMALLLAAAPARAEVDLELVLAVDCSGSVSNERFELQKQGYAAAFRNSRVITAIGQGANQAIAVTMLQWTGPSLQIQVVPWTEIRDEASARALADQIAATPRRLFRGGTSISGVIDRAMVLFSPHPAPGTRRVIDISGDGANNAGRPAPAARDDAVAAGVVINGLPILTVEPDLDQAYHDEVIGGQGAFLIAITSYEQFADAILRKLVTEIALNSGSHAIPQRSGLLRCEDCRMNACARR
jgi:hypothetical protein